jgi:hypothetical protein
VAKSNSLKVAKATEKPKAKKTKTAVSLTDDAIKRLGAACVVHQLDQSDIVEWLINQNLSGYVLQVRGPKLGIDGQSDGPATLPASVMADDRLGASDNVNSLPIGAL